MFISRLKTLNPKLSAACDMQKPLIAWTSDMSVQVKLLDNDHKKLLILLSDLHDGVINGYLRQILDMIFDCLVRATRAHFSHEEQFFTETAFPGALSHEREHDHIIERFKVLQVRLRNCTDIASSLDVIQLLKNCLLRHIEISDQQYVAHLKERELGSCKAVSGALTAALLGRQPMPPRIMQGVW